MKNYDNKTTGLYQVNNNRKRTRGRKYKHLKRKDGKTVKLMFPIVYTRI